MKGLDRSEHDCLQFLRILDRYAKENGFANGRGKPEDLLKENAPMQMPKAIGSSRRSIITSAHIQPPMSGRNA